jgi:hypothetical protein
MQRIIANILSDYERGIVSRRQRQALTGLVAAAAAAANSTFQGVGLNHIAVRVTSIPRSPRFLPETVRGSAPSRGRG